MRSVRVCRRGELGILRGDRVLLGLAMGRLMGGGSWEGRREGSILPAACTMGGVGEGSHLQVRIQGKMHPCVKSAREVGIHSVSF